jgi:transportin-2
MNPQVLQDVYGVLSAANPQHGNHRAALERLVVLQQQPHFFECCSVLFSDASVDKYVRLIAGMQIKNNARNHLCIANPAVKPRVISAVCDAEVPIRNAACAIVSAAVRELAWPTQEVVVLLIGFIQPSAPEHQLQGATRALMHVVEDSVQLLDMHQLSGPIITAIAPLVTTGSEKVRANVLGCLTNFLEQAGIDAQSASYLSLKPVALAVIQGLFENLQRPMSVSITELSIKGLVLSLTFYDCISDELFGQIGTVMIQACTSTQSAADQESIRIEATSFWRAVLFFPHFVELCRPVFPQVIPVIIASMVYSDMEMGMLQAQASDWNVPDRPDDIKPRHYQSKTQSLHEDDDGDDDVDGEVEEWNLRRVSAMTLDDLATHLGDSILFTVLSVIDQMMQPTKPWRELEAAILALGAIADGVQDAMTPYLPTITERLLELLALDSTHFLVKAIICWALRKFSTFLLMTEQRSKLDRAVTLILQHMVAPSKFLQEAATAAVTDFVSQADEGQLKPHLTTILQGINMCFKHYQLKNRLLLLEATEAICRTFGTDLANESNMNILLEPLIGLWQQIANDSPLIFSFFECMSAVCSALGFHVQPLAKEIFERGFGMLQWHMTVRQRAAQGTEELPEHEFVVTSADLLTGLFEALGASLQPLVEANQPTFINIVLACLSDETPEVRQSGFALLGEISRSCPVYAQSCLATVFPALLQNFSAFNERTYGVVSNAAWCIRMIIENQMELDGTPVLSTTHFSQLFNAQTTILCNPELTPEMRNMAENLCLGLGVIMHRDPSSVDTAAFAASCKPFLEYTRNIKSMTEKDDPLRGFLDLCISREMAVVAQYPALLVDLALSVADGPADIAKHVQFLLSQVRAGLGAGWAQSIASVSGPLQQRLFELFNIR